MKEKDFVRRYRLRIKKGACPICGCKKSHFTDHYASYPEIWWDVRCDNCGQVLEFQDNSHVVNMFEEIRFAGVRSKKKVFELLSYY